MAELGKAKITTLEIFWKRKLLYFNRNENHDSFEDMTPALAMLFSSILFLFYGAGKFAPKRHA